MVEHFKNELRNYEYYKITLNVVNEKLKVVWYELTGVKAIQYDKQPSSPGKKEMTAREINLRKKIDMLEYQKARLENQINYIEDVLGMLDSETRLACLDVYVKKRKIVDVSQELYISPSGLYKQINRNLMKALKKEVS